MFHSSSYIVYFSIMKNLLFISAMLISASAFAQSSSDEAPVRQCEVMPLMEECEGAEGKNGDRCTQSAIMQFVGANITYPAIAKENGIEGTVYVTFVIEKDGTVTGARLLRDLGEDEASTALEEAAVEAISKLPAFKPGTQNGEAVRVSYAIPVKFVLS